MHSTSLYSSNDLLILPGRFTWYAKAFAGLLLLMLFQACTPSPVIEEEPAEPQVGEENGLATISLQSGFQPDPFIYELRAGGPVEASDQGFSGYIPASPSAVLEFSPDKFPLTIILRSNSDTVMMLRTPGGQTLFNDDFEELNAGFTLYEPESGQYEIYAGLLNDSLPVAAELEITEIYAPNRPAPVASPGLDEEPLAGRLSLEAGFSPEPFTQETMLEGTLGFGDAYNGFFTQAPTFSLDYTAGSQPLTLLNESEDTDTVMLVYTPEGQWEYNDDFDGLNAGVRFDNPASGEYLIWMGTYGEISSPGRLLISESYVPQSERMPELGLAPEYDSITLTAGFEPDPLQREAFLFGDQQYAEYSGVFSEAPSFILDYEAGGPPLSIVASGQGDTVMLLHTPGGEWLYSDDFDDLNAGFYFENPESGTYQIWMGSYEDDGIEAMLEISESYTPPSERRPDISAAPGEQLEFVPGQSEPMERSITLNTNIELFDLGSGFVSEQPQFAVQLPESSSGLSITAISELDSTLLVHTPSGEWLFNDDTDGRNPAIELSSTEAGKYLIWVGSFYSLEMAEGMENSVRFRIE